MPAQQSEEHPLYALDPFHLAQVLARLTPVCDTPPRANPALSDPRLPPNQPQLALRDAERACELRPEGCATALHARGRAFFLLDQFPEAEASYLAAVALEPHNQELCGALSQVARHMAERDSGGQAPAKVARLSEPELGRPPEEDVECTLCLKVLYQPITTPCGHSFCRPCLAQSLDHRNRCPLCRTVLLMHPQSLATSVTLNNLVQRVFPEQYAARAAEEEAAAARAGGTLGAGGAEGASTDDGATALLPLFVMDIVLPGQQLSLNVFEPRYRLMTRRVMSGTRRFGMVGITQDRQLLPVATEVEILECQPLPDGRFYLEVIGRRRVRILSTEDQDGYRLARVELEVPGGAGRFRQSASREALDQAEEVAAAAAELAAAAAGEDAEGQDQPGAASGGGDDFDGIAPMPSTAQEEEADAFAPDGASAQGGAGPADSAAPPPPSSLPALAQRADALVSVWLSRLRIGNSRAAGYLAVAGERPPASDPTALSWWIANVLPVPAGERYRLLACPTVAHRLRRELELMRAAQTGGAACGVM